MGESQLEPGFETQEPDFGQGADASPEAPVEETEEAEAEPVEAQEDQESEPDSPPGDEEDVEEKTDPFQERINKLTKRFRSLERESSKALEAAQAEVYELRKQLAEAPQERPKTLADFDYNEADYQTYIFEQAEKRAEQAVNRRLAEVPRESPKVNEAAVKFSNAETKFAVEHDDYHDVVYDPTLRISPDMRDYVQVSEIGPELVYHLGKNPDIAMDIAGLPPALVGRELGKIEDGLLKAKAKPKDVSKAPPPPKGDLGGGTAAPSVKTTTPASDKLSDAEWFAKEEARLAKQRG
jgi:hypothetical protein